MNINRNFQISKFLRESYAIITLSTKYADYRVIKNRRLFAQPGRYCSFTIPAVRPLSDFFLIVIRVRKTEIRKQKLPYNLNIIRLLIRVKHANRLSDYYLYSGYKISDRSIVFIHVR